MKTFLRRLEILNYLKASHESLSTDQIAGHLVDGGYLDDTVLNSRSLLRVVQRDLRFLLGETDEEGEVSNDFGLSMTRGNGKSLHWQLDPYQLLNYDFEKMPTYMALAFSLVKKHLSQILPRNTLSELERFFAVAENKLHLIDNQQSQQHSNARSYETLTRSVEYYQRGQSLQPAPLDMNVLNDIYRAILDHKQLEFGYRNKSYRVHPYGVVIMLPKLYLIGIKDEDSNTIPDHDDYADYPFRSFLIHQISELFVRPQSAHISTKFNLKDYLQQGYMDVMLDAQDRQAYQLKLRLYTDENSNLISDLRQNPIALDQTIEAKTDNYFVLQASVRRTVQLRNWLLGLGEMAEVVEPDIIRNDLLQSLQATLGRYRHSD